MNFRTTKTVKTFTCYHVKLMTLSLKWKIAMKY